jgi:hypothetical protein
VPATAAEILALTRGGQPRKRRPAS